MIVPRYTVLSNMGMLNTRPSEQTGFQGESFADLVCQCCLIGEDGFAFLRVYGHAHGFKKLPAV